MKSKASCLRMECPLRGPKDGCWSSLLPIAVIQHSSERRWFISASKPQVTAQLWGNASQELKLGTSKQKMKHGHGGALLTGLLPMACSAVFPTQPRPTAREWHSPQWTRPFQINHQKGKHSTVRTRGQCDGIIFSVEIRSSQLVLTYVISG